MPRYKHDCTRCTPLGETEYDGTHYDLYFCPQGGFMPTVIARYGDDGPDYTSGIGFAKAHPGTARPLTVALERAVKRGLYKEQG